MSQVVNFSSYGSARCLTQAFGTRWVYIGPNQSPPSVAGIPAGQSLQAADVRRSARLQPAPLSSPAGSIQAGDEAGHCALRAIDVDTVLVCWVQARPVSWRCRVSVAAAWLQST